jgi:hypothetical protein
MTTITKIIDEIYNLKFTSNTFADKKHETSVKGILISNGLTEVFKSDEPFKYIKDKNNSNKIIDELKGSFLFIEQPFGSQSAPDFIICIDGFVLWLECKSSDNGKITWNTGFPRKDVLFIFTSKKKDKTTIFFGQDHEIWYDGFENDYIEFVQSEREKARRSFDSKFKTSKCRYYERPMFDDSTNYAENLTRSEFYEKVKYNLGIK